MGDLVLPNIAEVRPVKRDTLRERIEHHLAFSIGKDRNAARLTDWRLALAHTIRDEIIDPWFATNRRILAEDRKRVCYLSMEFLIGRLLGDATINLGLEAEAREAVAGLDVDYDALVGDEPDAALGNGGLGRLAACFLDSMSTVGVAAFGYGIRYDHGLFRQAFHDGWQMEEAEDWLAEGHVWEFQRPDAAIHIGFGGEVEHRPNQTTVWRPSETVIAQAYDTPVPGWRGKWVNTLRLWSAHPTQMFELEAFNRGDFFGAAAPAVLAQTISRVLYPNDSTPQGRELRLKQEYFFTAASLRDIVHRFERQHSDLRLLPQKFAIQLNDTHPAIAGPELIRLMMDERGIAFDEAYDIARGCLNYTNHTLLPEALERWPIEKMRRVLPRHLEIIGRIDERHARDCVAAGRPRSNRVSVFGHDEVRMGQLAFIMAHRVNGVSALHTELMKETVFDELHALHPDRVVNQTNGVTPRRWLYSCNSNLRALLVDTIGDGWVANLDELEGIAPYADDPAFREKFAAAKRANKGRLSNWVGRQAGIAIDPDAMYDIQIKRFHEYKRQLLNILETVALYNEMRRTPEKDWTPRVKIFGGKAAPGYQMAKLNIKLINDVARVVNSDASLKGRLKIVFPPNYNVSKAERLIPAADLSEQISTAGMEASGTGNMKFALNGALTVGTLDGANVEIAEHVGRDNIFIFGLTTEEVAALRHDWRPGDRINASPRLKEVVEQIAHGTFSPDDAGRFRGLTDDLWHRDWFMVTADFDAYYDAQRGIDDAWKDPSGWTRRAVLNTAHCGWFSSDRTIRGYAREIWNAPTAY